MQATSPRPAPAPAPPTARVRPGDRVRVLTRGPSPIRVARVVEVTPDAPDDPPRLVRILPLGVWWDAGPFWVPARAVARTENARPTLDSGRLVT